MPRLKSNVPRRPVAPSRGNRLLGLLLSDDLHALSPFLEPYTLKARETLLEPDVPVTHVYFVEEGMVSLVQLLENGKFTETGIVGREGMVGALAPLGASAFSHEAVVQVSGKCLRMHADALRTQVALRPALRDLLLRYIQALFSQVAQSAVCNNQHSIQRRLARWLTMASDCLESNVLPLTHDLLATMLGVRRSSVSEALASLRTKGFIEAHKKGVVILDRPGLQGATCECYRVVRNDFRRLLGPSVFQNDLRTANRGEK